jgi:D-aminopeptidase
MSDEAAARLARYVRALPAAFPGPGGAIAVLRRGDVLVRHAWGYANAERRLAFTPRSLVRICSVTKHLVCAALLATRPDPETLTPALRARLPRLAGPLPTIAQLCHNQSGLRDYWAVAMLLGAGAEDPFGEAEAVRLIAGTRSTQFAPGTRYSYCNQNFRLLGDLLAEATGRSLAELLRHYVFAPAGMESALLAADTRAMPDGTEGYEGSVATGFRPAVNRIHWTGDAGIGASLDDMIAWERQIDATRDDPGSLPARLAAPVAFADGRPAAYGFGLDRPMAFARALTAHSGALRGWRSHRLHLAAERVSVVVLFNHDGDAQAAARGALAALLDARDPVPDPRRVAPDLLGIWREPETGLAVRVEPGAPGMLALRFGPAPDRLLLRDDGSAAAPRVTLRRDGDRLVMERPAENLRTRLASVAATPPTAADGLAGLYRCAELDAALVVADAGGVLHAACAGPLGQGRMEALTPLGEDLWAMPCPRALDVAPPGDWTLAVRRDGAGAITGLAVGCWLARNLAYERMGAG